MLTEFPKRFYFPNGKSRMNPFWIYKERLHADKYILERIVLKGSILGRTARSLNAAGIKTEKLEELVTEKILRKVKLQDLAFEVVKESEYQERRRDLESEGGFLSPSIDKRDRNFIRDFDRATDIVSSMPTRFDPEEIRYIVALRNLHFYIETSVTEEH